MLDIKTEAKLRKYLEEYAELNELKFSPNTEKIIKAKLRFFKGGDLSRCPCDANSQDRFCGSVRCLAETMENGTCHCRMFLNVEKE